MISARGPATGDIHACDAKPAAANAARIAGAAASAPAFDANQANTLGPAPERLAPSAPWSSAAALTAAKPGTSGARRSEEHTSELQSLMRISYAVFCLKKKKNNELTFNSKTHKIKSTTRRTHNKI